MARRGSLLPAESAAECSPKRRQSLLPVLRAASKGEEVTVISGMKSLEVVDSATVNRQSSLRMSSSRSATQKQEDREMPSERSEKVVKRQSSKYLTASSSSLKRRSTISLKEGMISDMSREFSQSGKLEDQINLQHLVELMTVFNVSCVVLVGIDVNRTSRSK